MTAADSASRPPAGVYLHWPFCERKCPYCDFHTYGREHPDTALSAAYAEALLREIESASARFGGAEEGERPRVDSLYLGGGTPSLMGPATFERLFAALRAAFEFAPDSEVTLEVNPTTAETADLPGYLAAGVNRLSVGAQSFNDRLLRELGRVHDAETTRRAIRLMRETGAANLSLDLIFGAPTQTLADFRTDLDELLSHAPEHLSAYNLTIHAGTPYARWQRTGRIALPGEDDQLAMFEHLIDTAAAAGYGHYEISNWARPGRAARHNGKYWRDVDIHAFGVSAHGVAGGRRYEIPRDLRAYIAAPEGADPHAWLDPPATERARHGEIMMLALRRVEGTAWSEVDAWSGANLRAFHDDEIRVLREQGLLESNDESFRLTRAGIFLSDSVMARFF